jgi:hypothetical protein
MRKDILGFCIVALLVSTSANAQFAGLLGKRFGLPPEGEVGGSYQSNNQIRTYITSEPYDNSLLYEKLITKASGGRPRFFAYWCHEEQLHNRYNWGNPTLNKLLSDSGYAK